MLSLLRICKPGWAFFNFLNLKVFFVFFCKNFQMISTWYNLLIDQQDVTMEFFRTEADQIGPVFSVSQFFWSGKISLQIKCVKCINLKYRYTCFKYKLNRNMSLNVLKGKRKRSQSFKPFRWQNRRAYTRQGLSWIFCTKVRCHRWVFLQASGWTWLLRFFTFFGTFG